MFDLPNVLKLECILTDGDRGLHMFVCFLEQLSRHHLERQEVGVCSTKNFIDFNN